MPSLAQPLCCILYIYFWFIEQYNLLQKTDGAPVHLKRGVMDKMLYRTTMGLTIGGALYCLMALYIAAQPRKSQWPALLVLSVIIKYIVIIMVGVMTYTFVILL